MGSSSSDQLDVILRLYQIVAIQALFYLCVSVSVMIISWINGLSPALALLLSSSMIDFSYADGWVAPIAYLIACPPLAVAVCLCADDRPRHCIDFTLTVYVMHVIGVVLYTGRIPSEVPFWILILFSIIIVSLGSEYLCVRRQLRRHRLVSSPTETIALAQIITT